MTQSSLRNYIDETVRGLILAKINENKKAKTTQKSISVNENIQKIKKNFRLLREYMEYENNAEPNGDAMLDQEISAMDAGTPKIDKFIENIKSETLDAMMQLSKNGESNTETFETLKKVFDICHNTQKKKENKNEAE
jgi:hypothetical protein